MRESNNQTTSSNYASPCRLNIRLEKDKQSVRLLGLDFGSTTSSALVAQARIVMNSTTGNLQLGDTQIIYRSEISFTPFNEDNTIDETRVIELMDNWLTGCGMQPSDFFSGGVIITGLAARRKNAEKLAKLIEERIGDIVVATADDPSLESWLAFMGSCGALSRYHKEIPIINLDIGGGTTNPALGLNGNVLSTGCHFIGARHIQFVPSTYQIRALTDDAKQLFTTLNIHKRVGEVLNQEELNRFIGFYIQALEQIVQGHTAFFKTAHDQLIEQVPFELPTLNQPAAITFSGGVGELVYQASSGKALPATTYFGDLGIDFAKAILQSPILSSSLKTIIPENHGRATVYGLALHSTEVSGATLFLPKPEVLPLRHLPIIAHLSAYDSVSELSAALQLVSKHPQGACLQVTLKTAEHPTVTLDTIRNLGHTLVVIFKQLQPPADQPIVLLIDCNVGKSLGSYATAWGQLPVNLIVIDEVTIPQANFVNISKPHQQVVPVSFYGIK
ncbi:ethanolamine ammonia-lyase reactivating factor EutA [Neisseria sp. Ec49-e6-T10]|uniref:ethanolamine ammonia-lyase reactivating factor EutA n=1 Tax=Neisseria sp. Ec49-e6-T10 TaxID=3140744 RepID=UPI003EB8BBB5